MKRQEFSKKVHKKLIISSFFQDASSYLCLNTSYNYYKSYFLYMHDFMNQVKYFSRQINNLT